MSQADLAAAAGVDTRQIRRYEAGQQQPVPSAAVNIANALDISLGELAGMPSQRVSLSGEWFAGWQSFKDGIEDIRVQTVRMRQHGEFIQIEALTRGRPIEQGGYLWRGELRLWDNEILMGYYVAAEGAIRSKGTFYYVMHPHGVHIAGRWVGLSYDGKIITGWSSMGHSEDVVRKVLDELKETGKGP